jgi:uncharacterized protein YjdB
MIFSTVAAHAADSLPRTDPAPVQSMAITEAPETYSYKEGYINEFYLTTVSPERATSVSAIWTSNNTDIATVDEDGLVQFTGVEGIVTITATATMGISLKASKTIDVVRNVTEIRTPLDTYYIKKGTNQQLVTALDDSTAPTKTITSNLTFKSSNPKALTVSNTGVLKASKKVKKTTKVKVTITAANGLSKTVKVYVVPNAKKLIEAKPSLSTIENNTGQISLRTKSATNLKVTFESSDPTVVSVDKAGKIVLKKNGKAVIKIKVGKVVINARITVNKI